MGKRNPGWGIGGVSAGTGFTCIANTGQKAWPDGSVGVAALQVNGMFTGNKIRSVLEYRSWAVALVADGGVRIARANL